MAYEHKEGTGSCLKNSYKNAPAQPDWKGEMMVDGKLREVAIWEGETTGGKPRLSIKIQFPRPKQGNPIPAPSRVDAPPQQRREMPRGDDAEPPPPF